MMHVPSPLAESISLSSLVTARLTTFLLCSLTVTSSFGAAGLACLQSHVLTLPSAPPVTRPLLPPREAFTDVTP